MNSKNKLSIAALILIGVSSLAAYVPYSITSGGNKERLERAKILADGTIQSQSTNWVSSVSEGGISGADYTLTLTSGIFSAAPMCICGRANGIGNGFCDENGVPTSTTIFVRIWSHQGSQVSGDFTIYCMGPRGTL